MNSNDPSITHTHIHTQRYICACTKNWVTHVCCFSHECQGLKGTKFILTWKAFYQLIYLPSPILILIKTIASVWASINNIKMVHHLLREEAEEKRSPSHRGRTWQTVLLSKPFSVICSTLTCRNLVWNNCLYSVNHVLNKC